MVEPGSFDKSRQTIVSEKTVVDELFNNDELEWSTKCVGSVYNYGLLVKMDEASS